MPGKVAQRFDIPVTKKDAEELNFYKPAEDSEELTYLREEEKLWAVIFLQGSFELESLISLN